MGADEEGEQKMLLILLDGGCFGVMEVMDWGYSWGQQCL